MILRIGQVAIAVVAAGATVALATVVSGGPGAVFAVLGAVAAALLVVTGAAPRGAAVAVGALAVACAAAATPTLGSDVGRGISIAAPPMAVAAAALAIGSRSRMPAVLAGGGATLAGPVRALFEDPFLDAACAACRHNAFAVLADRPTAVLVSGVGTVVLAAAIAAMIRRSSHPVLLVADATLAIGLLPVFAVDPVVIACAALALALLCAATTMVRVTSSRRRLAELERGLQGGATATELLRRATGDTGLTVDFGPRFVPDVGVAVVSGGTVIATVHSAAAGRLRPLLDRPDPALLVALTGERLDSELDAQVRALRESRSRVVVRADEERRRLERDLHDGAQQHVLALGFDLRAALVVEQDPARREVLEACIAESLRALDDLRDIAHGVYPPLLAIAGLGPALRALGTRTPMPIELGEMPGRLPQSVERVAYLLVSELAHDAAGPLAVSGAVQDDRLHLRVTCCDTGPSALLRERIAALDGTIAHHDEGREERWALTVPCA